MRPIPKNHATLEHGLAGATQFPIVADEPEKQQNNDKRDVAVYCDVPELGVVFEGVWKADKNHRNADNKSSERMS